MLISSVLVLNSQSYKLSSSIHGFSLQYKVDWNPSECCRFDIYDFSTSSSTVVIFNFVSILCTIVTTQIISILKIIYSTLEEQISHAGRHSQARMSPLKFHSFVLTSLVTLAAGGELLRRQDSGAFGIIPTFGFGEDCTDSFGETFDWCGPEEARYCYDPAAGDVCCFDSTDPWSCPVDSFCLVQNVCCDEGLDPATCATDNGVSLPADFSIDIDNGDNVETIIDEEIDDDADEVIEDVVDDAVDVIDDDFEEGIDVDDDGGVIGIIPDNVEEGFSVVEDSDIIEITAGDSEAIADFTYVYFHFSFFPFTSR